MGQSFDAPREAAIYLCIFLDHEMDGLVTDRRCEQCEVLTTYRQWEVIETYVDQSKSTKIRPAYEQMVADDTR